MWPFGKVLEKMSKGVLKAFERSWLWRVVVLACLVLMAFVGARLGWFGTELQRIAREVPVEMEIIDAPKEGMMMRMGFWSLESEGWKERRNGDILSAGAKMRLQLWYSKGCYILVAGIDLKGIYKLVPDNTGEEASYYMGTNSPLVIDFEIDATKGRETYVAIASPRKMEWKELEKIIRGEVEADTKRGPILFRRIEGFDEDIVQSLIYFVNEGK